VNTTVSYLVLLLVNNSLFTQPNLAFQCLSRKCHGDQGKPLFISAFRPRFCALSITGLHPGCLIGQASRVTKYIDRVERLWFVASSVIVLHAGLFTVRDYCQRNLCLCWIQLFA